MDEKEIFKGPAIITYLVKRLEEEHPTKQIGKTILQKLIFLFLRDIKNSQISLDYKYSIYYYGPYSSELSADLNFAQDINFIRVEWASKLGYYIKLKEKKSEV